MVRAETIVLILILPNVGKRVSMMSALLESLSVAGMQLTNRANVNRTISEKGLIFFLNSINSEHKIGKK